MVDRTDIDALLIGALYGELTPADEARLMAHLESHPADRTALDDLTRTRAAVRDSRILAFQLDPPQAISALLLQEAARRAPRAVTDRGEAATWFHRFVRSFAAHPAMAAAATLVLVSSVAGLLYLRGTDQYARPDAVAIERAPAPAVPTSAVAPPPPPPATVEAAATGAAPAGAGSGAYPGRLDGTSAGTEDNFAAKGELAKPQAPAAGDPSTAQGNLPGRASYEETHAAGFGAVRDAELRKLGEATKPAPARPSKPQAVRGIELRTPQPQPKDLQDSDDEKPATRRREATGGGRPAKEKQIQEHDARGAAPGGGAPATTPAAPPPPPAPAPQAAGPAAANFDAPASAANEAKRPPARSANQLPPPAAAPSTANAQNAQVDRRTDKAASSIDGDAKQAPADRTLLEWARKQREQVIAYVNANRCRDAASAAVEIYNRAPDYYNASVATDRQIKPCLAYVTAERDRADRSRANKNAADVQAPAQAAPAKK
ncbi:MAG TPA: hypothetical protein VHT91_08250 [Kofleriaceae bacterium]|nr:hypothetical protein [Kofleriaceae bacterium]